MVNVGEVLARTETEQDRVAVEELEAAGLEWGSRWLAKQKRVAAVRGRKEEA